MGIFLQYIYNISVDEVNIFDMFVSCVCAHHVLSLSELSLCAPVSQYFSPGISAAAQSLHPCAVHTLLSEEPLYWNTDEWCHLWGKKYFFPEHSYQQRVVIPATLTCIKKMFTVKQTVWCLTFCLQSRVQETRHTLPPQPDGHKTSRGRGLVNYTKFLFLSSTKQHTDEKVTENRAYVDMYVLLKNLLRK